MPSGVASVPSQIQCTYQSAQKKSGYATELPNYNNWLIDPITKSFKFSKIFPKFGFTKLGAML